MGCKVSKETYELWSLVGYTVKVDGSEDEEKLKSEVYKLTPHSQVEEMNSKKCIIAVVEGMAGCLENLLNEFGYDWSPAKFHVTFLDWDKPVENE